MAGDARDAGRMMDESHASLRDDYEVSTPALDRCVDDLRAHAGRARRPADRGGFGGCVVALADAGAVARRGWVVRPVSGRDGHRASEQQSASRSSALGVRTPHQKRSWPSTNATGATVLELGGGGARPNG